MLSFPNHHLDYFYSVASIISTIIITTITNVPLLK